MLPTIELGPAVIPTASLVYILGIWLALIAVEKAAAQLQLHVPWTYNLATVGLAGAFIAARVTFVASHWSAYRDNLLGIIWPLTSGYDLWAGLLVGVAAAFFYGRARRLPLGSTLDALTPGLMVALITISLADFLAGPGYGVESDVFWSISLFGVKRHPVQLYEAGIGILALLVWLAYRPGRKFDGQLFLVAAAIYSAGRLYVDSFRANAVLTDGGYHVVQIVALVILLGTLILLMRNSTTAEADPLA